MAELSERELKIIHIMHSLINYNLKDVPFEIRKNMILGTLKIRNIEYDEREITDLVQAVNAETKFVTQNALGLLGKYGHLLKDMGHFKI